jgi:hypothetical protein
MVLLILFLFLFVSPVSADVWRADRYWAEDELTYWIDPEIAQYVFDSDIELVTRHVLTKSFRRVEERREALIRVDVKEEGSLANCRIDPKFIIDNGTIIVLDEFDKAYIGVRIDMLSNLPYRNKRIALVNIVQHEFIHALNFAHTPNIINAKGRIVRPVLMSAAGFSSTNRLLSYHDKKMIREVYSEKEPVRILRFNDDDIGKRCTFIGRFSWNFRIDSNEVPQKYFPKGKKRRVIK